MTDTKHKTQFWFTVNAIINIFFFKLRSIYSVSYFLAVYPIFDNTSEVEDYLRLSRMNSKLYDGNQKRQRVALIESPKSFLLILMETHLLNHTKN